MDYRSRFSAKRQNALLIVSATPCVITLPDELPTKVPSVVPKGPLALVNVLE